MQIYITEKYKTEFYETIIELNKDKKFVFSYNNCDHSVKRHCEFCGAYVTDIEKDKKKKIKCQRCDGTYKVLNNFSFNNYLASVLKSISEGADIEIAFWV